MLDREAAWSIVEGFLKTVPLCQPCEGTGSTGPCSCQYCKGSGLSLGPGAREARRALVRVLKAMKAGK